MPRRVLGIQNSPYCSSLCVCKLRSNSTANVNAVSLRLKCQHSSSSDPYFTSSFLSEVDAAYVISKCFVVQSFIRSVDDN
jgi:hypothetical protein